MLTIAFKSSSLIARARAASSRLKYLDIVDVLLVRGRARPRNRPFGPNLWVVKGVTKGRDDGDEREAPGPNA